MATTKLLIDLLGGARAAVWFVLMLLFLVAAGWNNWRKEVYHTALNTSAVQRVQKVREIEQVQRDVLRIQAETLLAKNKGTENELQAVLNEIDSRPQPAERVVYKLRDRFICPPTVPAPPDAGGSSDGAGTACLSPADERFLVQEAAHADKVAHKLASCQDAHRAAAHE